MRVFGRCPRTPHAERDRNNRCRNAERPERFVGTHRLALRPWDPESPAEDVLCGVDPALRVLEARLLIVGDHDAHRPLQSPSPTQLIPVSSCLHLYIDVVDLAGIRVAALRFQHRRPTIVDSPLRDPSSTVRIRSWMSEVGRAVPLLDTRSHSPSALLE